MYKKSVAMLVILMALPAPALAASNTFNAVTNGERANGTLKIVTGSNSAKKSDRQKCLDMLLPQDGVDCLKKLKAKNK